MTASPARHVARPAPKDAINAALELFNRRWTLRILWELRDSALTFRQLQVACGDVSASVMSQRLTELREALLVAHDAGQGYRLAPHGQTLLEAFAPLMQWAQPWARAVDRQRHAAGNGP